MKNSYCFLLTSDYEGLSNSMLEALCIGIPCICTDCPPGGARQYISDNENGFLVPIGDCELLIQKINKIINEKDIFIKLKKNNINLRKKLDKNYICKIWENLINQER